MKGVVGLDVSLSNTGMCYIPGGWKGDLASIYVESFRTTKVKPTLGDPVLLALADTSRYLRIADRVVGFIRRYGARDIAIEHYAFSTVSGKGGKVQSASITRLAELGGAVKTQVLLSCKVPVVPIPSNAGRKIVVGSLKKGNQKQQVELLLESFGLSFSNLDEMDAFVTAYARYCIANSITSRFASQTGSGYGD